MIRTKGRRKRRLVRAVIAITFLFLIYHFVLLPALLKWGASDEEYNRSLPGDDLVKHKEYKNTLALTVQANPREIWPWIAQMGLHKGGFYSYTWLENIFGCKLVNAERIHEEWQHPAVGDVEAVCQSAQQRNLPGWTVAAVQPQKFLCWKAVDGEWMMGLYIDSIDVHHSRLITRMQYRMPGTWTASWLTEKAWFAWAHCIMQRGMLRGIRKRAEGERNNSANMVSSSIGNNGNCEYSFLQFTRHSVL